MKKILLLTVITISLLLLTGCGKNKPKPIIINYEKEYKNVINKTNTYQNEKDESITFDGNYTKYVFVDLDKDKKIECVIDTGKDYLLLNYENKSIYGFNVSYDNFKSLKTDGTYMITTNAQDLSVRSSEFSKNVRTETIHATLLNDEYKIEDQTSTEEQVIDYFKKFYSKDDVEWINNN